MTAKIEDSGPRRLVVLIPVLNGMPYLRETFASLQSQSCKDFEVLLWDNGSTDGTVDEAREWIPSRIPGRIVEGQALPLHLCLARMVEEANAPYCARLDADDIAEPGRLERQLRFLEENPDVDVVGGHHDLINTAGERLAEPEAYPEEYPDILGSLIWRNVLVHSTLTFRRQAILDAGNYQHEKPCEDFELWIRASMRGRLRNLPESVLKVRMHESSVIAQARKAGELEESNAACIAKHAQQFMGLTAAQYRELRSRKSGFAFATLLSLALRLASHTNVSPVRILFSPWFLLSARVFTSQRDLLSKAAWRLVEHTGKCLRLGYWSVR